MKRIICLVIIFSFHFFGINQAILGKDYNVIVKPKDQIVLEYSKAELSCKAQKILPVALDEKPIEMEWRKASSEGRIDICDGSECDANKVKCLKCSTNPNEGELSIYLKNVTWQDRGSYICVVMSEAILTVNLKIAVRPSNIKCYLSDDKYYVQQRQGVASNRVICEIGCTYPEPIINIVGDHDQVVGIQDGSSACSGYHFGMKKYRLVYSVGRTKGYLFNIDGIGYHYSKNITLNSNMSLATPKPEVKSASDIKYFIFFIIAVIICMALLILNIFQFCYYKKKMFKLSNEKSDEKRDLTREEREDEESWRAITSRSSNISDSPFPWRGGATGTSRATNEYV